jgi:hypothetical protein
LAPFGDEGKGDLIDNAFKEVNLYGVNESVIRNVEATHQFYEKLKQYIN